MNSVVHTYSYSTFHNLVDCFIPLEIIIACIFSAYFAVQFLLHHELVLVILIFFVVMLYFSVTSWLKCLVVKVMKS